MAGSSRRLSHPTTWGINFFSGVVVSVYFLAVLSHVLINRYLHRAMANEGLAVWQAFGTVIAATIATVYGASYAFKLNRQKDVDDRRKNDLESGRWSIVVLISNLTNIANNTFHLYEAVEEGEGWEILSSNIDFYQVIIPFDIEKLKFLAGGCAEYVNFLTELSTKYACALEIQDYMRRRNELRQESKTVMENYFNSHQSEKLEMESGALSRERHFEIVMAAMGERMAFQLLSISQNAVSQCEYGIKSTIEMIEKLTKILKREFPEEIFEPLNYAELERVLGKRLWDPIVVSKA